MTDYKTPWITDTDQVLQLQNWTQFKFQSEEISLPGSDSKGAKTLRAGAHTKQERFDQLYPMVIELFHTLQDFLEAHEDFVLTVGHSYFLDNVMKKFNMKYLDETPTHKLLPENIKQLHAPSKQKIFDAIMEEVIADVHIPYETQRSSDEDIHTLVKKLKNLDLWNFHENRALTLFSGISHSPFKFDTDVFFRNMKSTIFRLQRDLPCEADDDNNLDDDDDDDDDKQSDQED
ncbi:unnamed protein product [Mytilus coruscus]|uniref:Uncharacterized protein n=1 Tax=Mytilus coruscus TaxID=42192 RepID=A0A6J8CU52_MYTCO|nr:unnamed protein product [Mytilus coruscus]